MLLNEKITNTKLVIKRERYLILNWKLEKFVKTKIH